jgi:uncharacterized protein (DUF488 family)
MAPLVLTVGYANRSITDLMALLRSDGIEFLIDVRSRPQSTFKPEFSEQPLRTITSSENMKYVFMGDLLGGRPADPSCYRDGHVIYQIVREKSFFVSGISRLRHAYEQGLRVALLCSESRPENCHRSKLIGYTLEEMGISVAHIDPTGSHVTQSEVMRRVSDGQEELFGEALRSRKSYAPKRPNS